MATTLQKMLSYIIELPVEKAESVLSGLVTVSLQRGQYKLSTKNAIYSFGKNYTSFSTAFDVLEIEQQPLKTVLVLGAGIGSVIDLLEKNSSIKKVTAVDADEVIIRLANKYLQSPLKNKVEFIFSDAEKFIGETSSQYDLVLFDVFIEDKTPEAFMRGGFLKHLKNTVHKKGTLLFSKIEMTHSDKLENDHFAKIFSDVFPGAFSIDADGNKMFAWIRNDK
jgi:2-polyprenyl-3-methyl-5-hydroxy-6-metoxy-1,4-benzoquinol methylase